MIVNIVFIYMSTIQDRLLLLGLGLGLEGGPTSLRWRLGHSFREPAGTGRLCVYFKRFVHSFSVQQATTAQLTVTNKKDITPPREHLRSEPGQAKRKTRKKNWARLPTKRETERARVSGCTISAFPFLSNIPTATDKSKVILLSSSGGRAQLKA